MSNTALLPPSERDIPTDRQRQIRHQVMSRVNAKPRRLNRYVASLSAAASVLAIAAVVAVIAQSKSGSRGSDRQPAAPGVTRVVVDDQTFARRCGSPGGKVLVRFTDQFGGVGYVQRRNEILTCTVAVDGTVTMLGSAGLSPGELDPAPAASHVEILAWGDGSANGRVWLGPTSDPARMTVPNLNRPTVHDVFGTVAPDVARIVVTWQGRRPVEAAISGVHFAARYADTGGEPQQSPGPDFTVTAYATDGHVLNQVHQQD